MKTWFPSWLFSVPIPSEVKWGHCTMWGCWSETDCWDLCSFPSYLCRVSSFGLVEQCFFFQCVLMSSLTSKCAYNAEYRWNVSWYNPTSGQLSYPLSWAITCSSSMPSVCWQEELKPLLPVDAWSCLALMTLKHDLWVCTGDSRTSNRQGKLLSL